VPRHRARVVETAGVIRRLTAAGLARGAEDAATGALEHPHAGEADPGLEALDQAGREELDVRGYFLGT
jgi:hypothetical protein